MCKQLYAAAFVAGMAGGIGWGLFLAAAGWAQDRARRRRIYARIRRRLDEGKRENGADDPAGRGDYNELDPAVVELLMRLTEGL